MSEEKYTGLIAGLFQKMADMIGKDVYNVNFLILMFFTLFEVAAVFFDTIPGTDIVITRGAVWAVLIIGSMARSTTPLTDFISDSAISASFLN